LGEERARRPFISVVPIVLGILEIVKNAPKRCGKTRFCAGWWWKWLARMLPQMVKGFEEVESFRVTHILSQNADSYAGICSVRLRPGAGTRDVEGVAGFSTVQVLSKEPDGSLTIFTEGRPGREWLRPEHPSGGYHFPPFELERERWRMTFLGTETQISKNLEALESRGLRYKVVFSGDAKFGSESVLSTLSNKQREVIVAAYRLGYFNFPRRIKSAELATALGIAQSTLAQHLRKAEKKILERVISAFR
jgi:hypothetical protein